MVRHTKATTEAKDFDQTPTKTGYTFKNPDACSLYRSGHAIATAFADVLEEFEDAFDVDAVRDGRRV